MRIQNTEVYEVGGGFRKKEIRICGERIAPYDLNECSNDDMTGQEDVYDFSGLKSIPMLVDIHFHGCDGVDFCDAMSTSEKNVCSHAGSACSSGMKAANVDHDKAVIQKMADYELRQGIGAICPATMTLGEEQLLAVMEAAANYRNGSANHQNGGADHRNGGADHWNGDGADLVGINMEGPFLNEKKKGAQSAKHMRMPDAEEFFRLQEKANGLIKLCDIAPELPGAEDCIRRLKGEVVVSIAHTCTDYEIAKNAFALGASHVTHLYNAMPGIGHREPGPIVAAWESGAEVEIIADGIHLHPAVVRMTFQLFGDDRIILISDSMRATGLTDGRYTLGGQDVTVSGNRAFLTEDPGTIAGSVTNLMDCLRTAVLSMGIPLESAVKAAAVNPARSIGVAQDYGSLEAGRYANILFVNDRLEICHMIHKGRLIL